MEVNVRSKKLKKKKIIIIIISKTKAKEKGKEKGGCMDTAKKRGKIHPKGRYSSRLP